VFIELVGQLNFITGADRSFSQDRGVYTGKPIVFAGAGDKYVVYLLAAHAFDGVAPEAFEFSDPFHFHSS
jgi:hypothetical protein